MRVFAHLVVGMLLAVITFVCAGCSTPKHDLKAYRDLLETTRKEHLDVELPTFSTEPLTLRQCYALALLRNERLALQGERYVQALIARDRAWSSFLPSLSVGGSYRRQQSQPGQTVQSPPVVTTQGQTTVNFSGPPLMFSGSTTLTSTTTQTEPVQQPPPPNEFKEGAWTGSWTLFNGFRNYFAVMANRLSAEQQRQALFDLERTVLLEVASAFHQVLLAEDAVRIIRSAIAVQDESLREARARVEVGVARKLDVYQSEAQGADFRVQLVNAELSVYTARQLLSLLVDFPVGGPLVDDMLVPETIPTLEELMREAAANRPDLVAAARAVESAEQSIRIAFGGFAPTVSLNALDTFYRRPGPLGVRWSYTVDVLQPLFRGGRTLQDVRDAYSAFRQAELARQLLERQVQHDVAVSRAELLATGERIKQLEIRLAAAEEALRQAKAQYRVGLATNLDVLTAQNEQLSAELQLQTERHRHRLQYLNVRRVVGHLPLPPNVEAPASAH